MFVFGYPLAQVAGEDEVAGEGVGERRVELQHLHQGVSADDVQVAVGQRSHVGARPRQRALLPEHVPKHVTFTCGGRRGAESVRVRSVRDWQVQNTIYISRFNMFLNIHVKYIITITTITFISLYMLWQFSQVVLVSSCDEKIASRKKKRKQHLLVTWCPALDSRGGL